MIGGVIQTVLIGFVDIRVSGGLNNAIPAMHRDLILSIKIYLVIETGGDFSAFGEGCQTGFGLVVVEGDVVVHSFGIAGVAKGVSDVADDVSIIVALD